MQHVMNLASTRQWVTRFLSVMAMALLFSCSKNAEVPPPATQEATATNASPSNEHGYSGSHRVPLETSLFVPCANNGAGEEVAFTGLMNFAFHINYTDRGFTLVYHDNVQQLTGTGTISGERFVASGGTNGTVMGSWVNNQWAGTTIRQMRVVGQQTRFTVTYKYHITVTADGEVAVRNMEQSADCN